MAPWGFMHMHRRVAVGLLAAGLLVQVAALGTDPYRLYLRIGLPMPFYVSSPDLYFHPALSHLINRPLELAEVLTPRPALHLLQAPFSPRVLPGHGATHRAGRSRAIAMPR